MPSTELKENIIASKSPLVSTDQLEKLIGAPDVKLFDVRGTWKSPARALPEDYAESHIPGATFLDWTRHFIDPDEMVGLASVADQKTAMQSFHALGIDSNDLVILYDNYHHMQAGRIWWAMRYWGFANVRVLNGGWDRWCTQSKPTTTDVPNVMLGDFAPVQQGELRISLTDFLASHTSHCLIDARGPISYAGTLDDPTTGHIPGALSIPFSKMLDDNSGLFLGGSALARVFDAHAPTWRDTPLIASCGSGYAATVTLLALSELGYVGRLFDGSFSVWKQDPNRPIEKSKSN